MCFNEFKILTISNFITHLNVRSLGNKTDKMSIIILILNFPTVICLSEIWLKANEQIEEVPNYIFISTPWITGAGDGVDTYIRKNVYFQISSNLVMT